jgi:hypothetical protein
MAKKGIITPAGPLTYPRLFKPDMKYKKEYGELKTGQILTAEQAKEHIDRIEALIKDETAKVKAENAKKGKTAKIKMADKPYTLIEDGPHKGSYEFRFKKAGGGKDKDSGEVYTASVAVFDAFGKPFQPGFLLGSGTIAQVSYEPRAFFVSALGVGCSLRLIAVKIVEAKAYESDATSFGFEVEDAPAEDAEGEESEDGEEAAEEGAAPSPKAKADF